ncbi:MAG: hypothetical protein Q8Q01_04155 [archaeon]|nr:hypothetical protein [archaeon]
MPDKIKLYENISQGILGVALGAGVEAFLHEDGSARPEITDMVIDTFPAMLGYGLSGIISKVNLAKNVNNTATFGAGFFLGQAVYNLFKYTQR